MMNLGIKLAKLCQAHSYSQDDLSHKAHVSQQTISNWETGKTYPDITSLVLISNIYDLSLDDLVQEDLPIMKHKLLKQKLLWLLIGILWLIVLTYLALFSLKYSKMLGSLLVGSTTVLGLGMIFMFLKYAHQADLNTFQQVINYLHDRPVKVTPKSSKAKAIQYITGGIIGLTMGLILTWLIFKFVLGINLF